MVPNTAPATKATSTQALASTRPGAGRGVSGAPWPARAAPRSRRATRPSDARRRQADGRNRISTGTQPKRNRPLCRVRRSAQAGRRGSARLRSTAQGEHGHRERRRDATGRIVGAARAPGSGWAHELSRGRSPDRGDRPRAARDARRSARGAEAGSHRARAAHRAGRRSTWPNVSAGPLARAGTARRARCRRAGRGRVRAGLRPTRSSEPRLAVRSGAPCRLALGLAAFRRGGRWLGAY